MRTCGFCGQKAVAHSKSERTDICRRCMTGYAPGDVHGFRELRPIADAVLFGFEAAARAAELAEAERICFEAPRSVCDCNGGIIGEYQGESTRFCDCADGLEVERACWADWEASNRQLQAAEARWSQIAV